MVKYSSAEAAKKLGLSPSGLSKHIRLRKIPAPEAVKTGQFVVHAWTAEDIERVRKILPKIKNGRKTRYQKKHSAVSTQQSVRTKNRKKLKKKAQSKKK